MSISPCQYCCGSSTGPKIHEHVHASSPALTEIDGMRQQRAPLRRRLVGAPRWRGARFYRWCQCHDCQGAECGGKEEARHHRDRPSATSSRTGRGGVRNAPLISARAHEVPPFERGRKLTADESRVNESGIDNSLVVRKPTTGQRSSRQGQRGSRNSDVPSSVRQSPISSSKAVGDCSRPSDAPPSVLCDSEPAAPLGRSTHVGARPSVCSTTSSPS